MKNIKRINAVISAFLVVVTLVSALAFAPTVSATVAWVEDACYDPEVYRNKYEDLKNKTDEDLKAHWLTYGIKEGRVASVILDLPYYAEQNPDLAAEHGNDYAKLYEHFVTYGYKEHRISSRLFDGQFYCDTHKDVANEYKEEYLRHYIEFGMKEGRKASKTFDLQYYLFIRPDVAKLYPNDYAAVARHYASHGLNEGRAGYDAVSPVITDVVFSDITAAGYNVSCKVTDNWGVSYVSFPTWTVANGQDDLAKDYLATERGTKNGDTYTFRVNTSAHNNEIGEYITHIYAVDKGGNKVAVKPAAFEVKDPIIGITLIASSSYIKDGDIIKKVYASTKKSNFLKQFANEVLKVKDFSGKELANSDFIGTGSIIELYEDSILTDKATVAVIGDIDGSGIIDTTDYLRVKSKFIGHISLNTYQEIAADVDGNGKIDSTDYIRIKGQFLGTFKI